MTLDVLYRILTSISGFTNKVVYRAWPEGLAPTLPFICYYEESTNNFIADNKVTKKITTVEIELYTKEKDVLSEALVESTLDSNDIPWEKYEEYIDSEHCYQITYTITI